MKNALLIAILALSVNAIAQINRPMTGMQHPSFISTESIIGINADEKGTISRENSRFHQEQIRMAHGTRNQRSPIQLFDSVYLWQLDTLTMGWEKYSRTIGIVYDASNNLTSYSGQYWNGSTWVNSRKGNMTHDARNNLILELEQEWNGSAWVNTYQYVYTYDAGNNRINEVYQHWVAGAWVNINQYTFTYDVNNNLTTELHQEWSGSAWVNFRQYSDTYDASNNPLLTLEESWNGSAWLNYNQLTYTYDAGQNLTNELHRHWDGSSWVNSYQYTFTYVSGHNPTIELSQTWTSGVWVNSWKSTNTYDASNNLTRELYQNWNGSAWENDMIYNYSYDANNFMKSYSRKMWKYTGAIISGDSAYYYFHTVAGINDLLNVRKSISVYPNPCNGTFTLGSISDIRSVEIFNTEGERVYSDFKFDGQTSKEVDLSGYRKGIYMIKLQGGKDFYYGKIVVQ